jgi:hypothetical protein
MARQTWMPPGPQPGDPTLRMAKCVRCGSQYTDVAGTTAACTFNYLGTFPGQLCGMPVAIAADPAALTTVVGVGTRGFDS